MENLMRQAHNGTLWKAVNSQTALPWSAFFLTDETIKMREPPFGCLKIRDPRQTEVYQFIIV